MTSTLKQFKARAMARAEVRKAYDELTDEFAFLDEVLKARTEAGLTQAEVAARAGTTQSAIAPAAAVAARGRLMSVLDGSYADSSYGVFRVGCIGE